MREQVVETVGAVLLALLLSAPSHASDSRASAGIPKTANINLPYPGQIDLDQEPSGWTFRLNLNELPLYISTADPPGKSACNEDCAKKWIPVIAEADSKPLGDWTIVVRKDGKRQWAFKNHPVYTHVNDSSNKTTGVAGSFHLMPHFH
jgi:hypothetical protein